MRRKKHIITQDMVGLLLGEAVSTKTHITKDVVGLLLGEVVSTKKNTHHCKGCGWLTSRR